MAAINRSIQRLFMSTDHKAHQVQSSTDVYSPVWVALVWTSPGNQVRGSLVAKLVWIPAGPPAAANLVSASKFALTFFIDGGIYGTIC